MFIFSTWLWEFSGSLICDYLLEQVPIPPDFANCGLHDLGAVFKEKAVVCLICACMKTNFGPLPAHVLEVRWNVDWSCFCITSIGLVHPENYLLNYECKICSICHVFFVVTGSLSSNRRDWPWHDNAVVTEIGSFRSIASSPQAGLSLTASLTADHICTMMYFIPHICCISR